MVREGTDGPEVSTVKRQYGVGSELICQRHVHYISKIEMQVEVAGSNGLCCIEDVGCDLGEHGTTCPHPAPDVIDRLVCGIAAEDTVGDVIKLAEQYRRDDQCSGVAQHCASCLAIRVGLVEGG